MNKSPKIGIALGSGGARGVSHAGILMELEAMGIKPAFVTGASIGSLIGAGYAGGRLSELLEAAERLDWRDMFTLFVEWGFPKGGLIEGKGVMDFLKKVLPTCDIEDLSIPFACVAADLETGEEIVLDKGPVLDAVRASISIPGVFAPKCIGERVLVDGGVVNPIPVQLCRDMGADIVIAVDINKRELHSRTGADRLGVQETAPPADEDSFRDWVKRLPEKIGRNTEEKLRWAKERVQPSSKPVPNIINTMINTMRIIEMQIGAIRLKHEKPDLLLQPEVGHLEALDFHHSAESLQAGIRVVRDNRQAIEALLP